MVLGAQFDTPLTFQEINLKKNQTHFSDSDDNSNWQRGRSTQTHGTFVGTRWVIRAVQKFSSTGI